MSDSIVYLALFASVVCSSASQIFQKLAAVQTCETTASLRLINPYVLLSFASLGLALLLWLVVLSVMPVSQAYPMLSLSYIVVMLLARWLFKEQISLQHWLGAGLIMLGISCLMGGK